MLVNWKRTAPAFMTLAEAAEVVAACEAALPSWSFANEPNEVSNRATKEMNSFIRVRLCQYIDNRNARAQSMDIQCVNLRWSRWIFPPWETDSKKWRAFYLLPALDVRIVSIVRSSSVENQVFLKHWRESLSCSGLLTPMSTEVM